MARERPAASSPLGVSVWGWAAVADIDGDGVRDVECVEFSPILST